MSTIFDSFFKKINRNYIFYPFLDGTISSIPLKCICFVKPHNLILQNSFDLFKLPV